MRALIKYLRNQYLLQKIDEHYLNNLVSLSKITANEKSFIITGEE